MLAHGIGRVKEESRSIECISPAPRLTGCMRRFSVPTCTDSVERNELYLRRGLRSHMCHGNKVIAVEDSLLSHTDLCANILLIGCTDDVHTEQILISECLKGQGGQYTPTAASAVTTSVPQATQRIIFSQQSHAYFSLWANLATKCRPIPCKWIFNLNAVIPQQLHNRG